SLANTAGLVDPKVIYDQHADRFVVVMLDQVDTGGTSGNSSHILVAVSDDSDPNGNWCFKSIDSQLKFGGKFHWTDYPGLAVDDKAIYITGNQFTFQVDGGDFSGSRLWIVHKDAGAGQL